jgi:N-acetylmuramoyl-L-alanine amidase
MNLFLILLISFKTVTVPVLEKGGNDYVSLDDILKTFKFRKVKGEIGFIGDGHHISFFPERGYCLIDGKKKAIRGVYREGRKIFLPGEVWASILSEVFEENLYYDFEKNRFIFSKYPPSIKKISIKRRGDTLDLEIIHNVDLDPEIIPVSPGDLRLKIKRGFFRGPYKLKGDGKLIDEVVIRHTGEGALIYLSYNLRASYKFIGKPGKSVVSIYTPSKKEKGIRSVDVIVIDPGHGGRDPGAIGRRGTREKDVVLKVAKKLKRILERETNLKVYLTRDSDVFVPLRERTRMANRLGADIFISLHCNFARSRTAQGIETYFLSEARTEWERAVAAFENAALRYELDSSIDTTDILKYILMDLAQTEFLKESQDLAAFVQEAMVKKTRRLSRGVKQAGFYVLAGAYMPSILVEISFISNVTEEKLLRSSKFQERIARGIADGIKEFLRKYRK